MKAWRPLLGLMLSGWAGFCGEFSAFAGTVSTIQMKSIAFEPRRLTIRVGDQVIWNNLALTEHMAMANDGKTFDTGPVLPQQSSKPVTFSQPGEFLYHCAVHGRTMTGLIIVKSAG